jgi:hypothetical protein
LVTTSRLVWDTDRNVESDCRKALMSLSALSALGSTFAAAGFGAAGCPAEGVAMVRPTHTPMAATTPARV